MLTSVVTIFYLLQTARICMQFVCDISVCADYYSLHLYCFSNIVFMLHVG